MINFPFGTNGKLIILGVLILKHITVIVRHCDTDKLCMLDKNICRRNKQAI